MVAKENTFESLAREWHAGKSRVWSAIHAKNVLARLEGNIFPWIGKRPITEITLTELLQVLRRIEERGAYETAHRVHGNCSEVFSYAIASGRAERNIALDLKGALQPVTKTHLAAITEPARVGELLKMIDGYEGTPAVQAALKLAPLVFVRPGELRTAEWQAFDRSAIAAVKTTGRFPRVAELTDAMFETNFRKFQLIFKPQDLRY